MVLGERTWRDVGEMEHPSGKKSYRKDCGHVSCSDLEGKGKGAARKGKSEAARLINRLASLPSETSLNVTEGRDLRV